MKSIFFFLLRTKALVLELLAAVCLVRGGHEIILSAFDNFKEVRIEIKAVNKYYKDRLWSLCGRYSDH